MSKVTVFVKNQLLEKSLDGYRPTLRYGERVQMYNNIYKVLQFQDNGYAILEDEKNTKLAFPTNKLRMLMKNKQCQTLGNVNLNKSVSPPSKAPATSQKAGEPRGQPVGTVQSGKDGDQYKKISSNPSVWVRMSSGTVHHDPHGDEQDPMSVSHQALQEFHKMMSHIDSKIHPEDRAKVQNKAKEWIQENSKFKHMQTAHNTNEVDEKGQKLPRAGLPSSTLNQAHKQGDLARSKRQELIDLVKQSHLKLKGGSGAK